MQVLSIVLTILLYTFLQKTTITKLFQLYYNCITMHKNDYLYNRFFILLIFYYFYLWYRWWDSNPHAISDNRF